MCHSDRLLTISWRCHGLSTRLDRGYERDHHDSMSPLRPGRTLRSTTPEMAFFAHLSYVDLSAATPCLETNETDETDIEVASD
jgi:hypothetical protein